MTGFWGGLRGMIVSLRYLSSGRNMRIPSQLWAKECGVFIEHNKSSQVSNPMTEN